MSFTSETPHPIYAQIKKITDRLDSKGIERVMCAALLSEGKIWYGHRHPHAMKAMDEELSWHLNRKQIAQVHNAMVQGFVTTKGRFLTREEAYNMQRALSIPSAAIAHGDSYRTVDLFSEDLY